MPIEADRRRLVDAVLLALTLPLATATVARAQDAPPVSSMSIEQLLDIDLDQVYSASRFLQDVRRAPASVTIITSSDIKTFGYQTLAQALSSVTGFYTTYDRNYTYLGVRGFNRPGDYNSRVLVMIDGYRANDAIYDEALIGTEFPVDVALIDRIEVIRGPSSSLYGNSAFFAVVEAAVPSRVEDEPHRKLRAFVEGTAVLERGEGLRVGRLEAWVGEDRVPRGGRHLLAPRDPAGLERTVAVADAPERAQGPIRVHVPRDAAGRAHMTISSRLLALASSVRRN
ncbi:MAG TPA: Plug domain-containing protein [Vicinamibacterales bacterium]|nr:Plug domain-containing protein [Vicinamibacterales bacterium]